jgi:hypothetical protein
VTGEGGYVTYDWWLVPVVYAGLSVVLLEARLQRAASRDEKLIFRGSLLLKLLYGGGAAGISILLYENWSAAKWWEILLLIVLLISCLAVWPKTILTDERGIECLRWWRPRVFIPWEQVEYAEIGKVGAIVVVGTHARITFEGYNADRARFCKEVTSRSNVKEILTPSQFTGLHL